MAGFSIINAKPGQRYVVGGHGFDQRGSWKERDRVYEVQTDGTSKFIGFRDELKPASRPLRSGSRQWHQ